MEEAIRLWVDDDLEYRKMPVGYTHWAHTYDEALTFLRTGRVTHLSLDNDLGGEKEGRHIALWIEEEAYFNRIPPIVCQVHSANSATGGGADACIASLTSAYAFWRSSHNDLDWLRGGPKKCKYMMAMQYGVDQNGLKWK